MASRPGHCAGVENNATLLPHFDRGAVRGSCRRPVYACETRRTTLFDPSSLQNNITTKRAQKQNPKIFAPNFFLTTKFFDRSIGGVD